MNQVFPMKKDVFPMKNQSFPMVFPMKNGRLSQVAIQRSDEFSARHISNMATWQSVFCKIFAKMLTNIIATWPTCLVYIFIHIGIYIYIYIYRCIRILYFYMRLATFIIISIALSWLSSDSIRFLGVVLCLLAGQERRAVDRPTDVALRMGYTQNFCQFHVKKMGKPCFNMFQSSFPKKEQCNDLSFRGRHHF